jgi:hypothetical protein
MIALLSSATVRLRQRDTSFHANAFGVGGALRCKGTLRTFSLGGLKYYVTFTADAPQYTGVVETHRVAQPLSEKALRPNRLLFHISPSTRLELVVEFSDTLLASSIISPSCKAFSPITDCDLIFSAHVFIFFSEWS